jgi:mRNA interferase MazF
MESVDFLEAMRKKQRALSVSAALEDILQSAKREQERISMEKAVGDYYSSLSEEEIEEQRAWADFSTREFARLNRYMLPPDRKPSRGEIWFVQFHTDPPGKGKRPVVIVSLDTRNHHKNANTVLVVPLTTIIHKTSPTHVFLAAGETGLPSDSAARAEDVSTVSKESLAEPRGQLRRLSDRRICELAAKVAFAMGC